MIFSYTTWDTANAAGLGAQVRRAIDEAVFAFAGVALLQVAAFGLRTACVTAGGALVDELDANATRSTELVRRSISIAGSAFASERFFVITADGVRIAVMFARRAFVLN